MLVVISLYCATYRVNNYDRIPNGDKIIYESMGSVSFLTCKLIDR